VIVASAAHQLFVILVDAGTDRSGTSEVHRRAFHLDQLTSGYQVAFYRGEAVGINRRFVAKVSLVPRRRD
jgi:hypothetical protein